MRREEHVLGEVFAYRFPASNPDHALLILHGIGGHGGIYDNFCALHSSLGVDVWAMDAPGHGRSCGTRPPGRWTLEEWVDAAVSYGEHIRETSGKPVFVLGSSLGSAAAYDALQAADVFAGAVIMGFAIPLSSRLPPDNPFRSEAYERIEALFGTQIQLNIERLFNFDEDYGYSGAAEQKKKDPLNTWHYDLKSWASLFRYDPKVPIGENTKPILYAVGENDPTFRLSSVQPIVDATAGPVEFHVEPNSVHQLMLFHTEAFSSVILEWCRRQLEPTTFDARGVIS